MNDNRAFTLIELLVVISIIALLIGILLPALGAARQAARQMQSNTHVRGIHQGMVIHAQANKTGATAGQYPGHGPNGSILSGDEIEARLDMDQISGSWNSSWHGGSTLGRYALMLDQQLFSPEYAVNPLETNTAITPYDFTDGDDWPDQARADSGEYVGNYSYALLSNAEAPRPASSSLPARRAGGRAMEWGETLNSAAVVIADRNLGAPSNSGNNHSHVTREGSGQWRGSVGWNDNHVATEDSTRVQTQYDMQAHEEDNLFIDTGGSGDNACLTHAESDFLTGAEDCDVS